MAERRVFVRAGEEARRRDLLAAASALVAEAGPQGATVRAIAARAGVTPGLIRHYFGTKEALLSEAYLALMDGMTETAAQAGGAGPVARLAGFVSANLRPPVVDGGNFALWAGFMQRVAGDSALSRAHEAGYLAFRDRLEALIAGCGVPEARAKAVAVNALIDGLWLEASVLPGAFAPGEVERIGLAAAGRITGLELEGA
jgi:TetR/AcrR family transcriptional regulator, transcriptional repressor of bet genes